MVFQEDTSLIQRSFLVKINNTNLFKIYQDSKLVKMPFDGTNFSLRPRRDLKPYLKCFYAEGDNFNEYLVRFNTYQSVSREENLVINDEALILFPNVFDNYMNVDRKDVIVLDDEKGLLKLSRIHLINGELSLVGIKDIADNLVKQRDVFTEEIIWR
jgi:hypothetical protein